MEAANSNDGWVVLLAKEVKGRLEVVGNVKAKGIFRVEGCQKRLLSGEEVFRRLKTTKPGEDSAVGEYL